MDWQKLESATIDAVAYESGQLRVRLTKGRIYEYESVPESVFQELVNCSDPETFYGLNIRGEFPSKKLRSPSGNDRKSQVATGAGGDLVGALLASIEMTKASPTVSPTPKREPEKALELEPVKSSDEVLPPAPVLTPEQPEINQEPARPHPPAAEPPATPDPPDDEMGNLVITETLLRSQLRTVEELFGRPACKALLARVSADFGLRESFDDQIDPGVLDRFTAVRLRDQLRQRSEWETLCDFEVPPCFSFQSESTALELARKTLRWVEQAGGCLPVEELLDQELWTELDRREAAGVLNALGTSLDGRMKAVAPGLIFMPEFFEETLAALEKELPPPCLISEAVDTIVSLTQGRLRSEMAEELLYGIWGATDADVRGEATITRYHGEETVADRIQALLKTYPEGLDEVEQMYAAIFPEHHHDDVIGWLQRHPVFSCDRHGYWKLRAAQPSRG